MVDNMPKLSRKLSLTIQHQTKFGKPNGLRLNFSPSFDDEEIEYILFNNLKIALDKRAFLLANSLRYTRVGCRDASIGYRGAGVEVSQD